MSSTSSQSVDRHLLRQQENASIEKTLLKFLAGGLSATSISVAMNSVDHVKTRLQIQQNIVPSHAFEPYKSFSNAFVRVYREEGFVILQGRGLFSSALREMSYSSVRMGLYDVFKHMLHMDGTGSDAGLAKKILAGGCAGAIGSYLANPFDLIKIRQQGELPVMTSNGLQPSKPQYKHTFAAIHQIYANEGGFKGLYRGVSATVARAAVVTSAQLSSYDHTKHVLISHLHMDDRFETHLISSLVAGLCTAIASNPVDVIKTRYMNDQKAYKGIVDCVIQTIKKEGGKALYKGFAPNYIRLGSHCLFTLPLYEQMRKVFGLTTM